jgi:SAM-dependent methyltransferase
MQRHGGYDTIPELAELYDAVPAYASRPDIGFYVELCRAARGDVLELGCGTGRVLIPAAEAGCRITGLDLSPHMLEQCRKKVAALPPEARERIRLVEGSMADFRLGRTFALITMPFRPLQHLVEVEEQLRCLRSARKHVEPGGSLVFDAFQVDPAKVGGAPETEETEETPEITLPDGRRLRRTYRILGKHRATQCNEVEIIYYLWQPGDAPRRIVQAFPFRYFYRYEIEHLLARAGFRVAELYGDFDRSALTDDSPEMIFVAEAAGPEG